MTQESIMRQDPIVLVIDFHHARFVFFPLSFRLRHDDGLICAENRGIWIADNPAMRAEVPR